MQKGKSTAKPRSGSGVPRSGCSIFLNGSVVPACNASCTFRGDVYRGTALLQRINLKLGTLLSLAGLHQAMPPDQLR
jgi:hypothetical protein